MSTDAFEHLYVKTCVLYNWLDSDQTRSQKMSKENTLETDEATVLQTRRPS